MNEELDEALMVRRGQVFPVRTCSGGVSVVPMPEPEVDCTSHRDGAAQVVPVVARDDLVGAARELLDRLREVPWSRLRHA